MTTCTGQPSLHHGKEEAVLLLHCEVKQAQMGEQLEVLVNKFTEIEQSSKQFDVCKNTNCGEFVELGQLHRLSG